MKEMNEHIDGYFKDRLEHFENTPPSAVWDNIADKLGHARKRKLVLFMSRIAAGIIVVVSIGIGYYFMTKNSSHKLAESAEEAAVQTETGTRAATEALAETAAPSETAAPAESEALAETAAPSETAAPAESKAPSESVTEHITVSADIATEQSLAETTAPQKEEASPSAVEDEKIAERFESITVDRIDNKIEESINTPGITIGKPAEEPAAYADYIARDIIYEEEKQHENRWMVGGQLAPLYSYRNLSSDYLDSYVKDQMNSKETGLITYAAGINVAVSPGRRLSLQSGLYYSKYGQQTDAVNVFTSTAKSQEYSRWDNNPEGTGEETTNILISQSIGTVSSNDDLLKFNSSINSAQDNSEELRYFNVPATPVEDNPTATQYFEYLEIPLVVKYKLIDRKIDFNILSGISTHFLIGNDLYLDYDDNNSRFSENVTVNTVNYSGSVGIGIEYPIMSKLLLNLEPKFRYYINPLVKNPSYNIHPYSLGIFTGISYVF
jgi:hypothetical protein